MSPNTLESEAWEKFPDYFCKLINEFGYKNGLDVGYNAFDDEFVATFKFRVIEKKEFGFPGRVVINFPENKCTIEFYNVCFANIVPFAKGTKFSPQTIRRIKKYCIIVDNESDVLNVVGNIFKDITNIEIIKENIASLFENRTYNITCKYLGKAYSHPFMLVKEQIEKDYNQAQHVSAVYLFTRKEI